MLALFSYLSSPVRRGEQLQQARPSPNSKGPTSRSLHPGAGLKSSKLDKILAGLFIGPARSSHLGKTYWLQAVMET